jgi:serine/threonine protein kinase
MEAADDQRRGQDIGPHDYEPRTLHTDLYSHKRLPLDDCLQIGVTLSSALQHLHQHRLVHRDIKPSNIVFVNGVPKLADIGLVADVDSSSYVGTEGFIPPEGPGTIRADIYSLGKVLYEILTGKDRLDFPELPSSVANEPDRRKLAALNKEILAACHTDPAKRHASVRDLHDILRRIQHGKRAHSTPWSDTPTKVLVTTLVCLLSLPLFVLLGLRLAQRRPLPPPLKTAGAPALPAPPQEECVFDREDVYSFLNKTITKQYAMRLLYSEIAAALDLGRTATWRIGRGMTHDKQGRVITTQDGVWLVRNATATETASEKSPMSISKTVRGDLDLPFRPLVTLERSELRVIVAPDGQRTLSGRIQCVVQSSQWVDHLALIFKYSGPDGSLCQQYSHLRTNALPDGWLDVNIPLDPDINPPSSGRFQLFGFIARPKAGFHRLSNELAWTNKPGIPS